MKNTPLLLCFLIIFSACKPDWKIEQAKVQETLTIFGKENPEKQVVIQTQAGEIVIKLYNETPLHRANFLRLVKNNYFKDRLFYRVVDGVCVQGGGEFDDRLGFTVPAEIRPNLKHKYGAIAMAMYDEDNLEKATSPTEFFIIANKNGYHTFDGEYTVFGEVIKGMNLIDNIYTSTIYDEKPVYPYYFTIK